MTSDTDAAKTFGPLPSERTLSIMPTFQCTAACDHCGTMSSPRVKTKLPKDYMLRAIDEAAELGYRAVVFTGGEATLARSDLIEGIARASSLGLAVRVVTNAYWANSEKSTQIRLDELKKAGLSEINFSTGDQHARFVPVENVIRAIRAALEAKLRVAVMVETVKERRVTKEFVVNHPDFRRILIEFPMADLDVHESPWMPLVPAAIEKYPEGVATNGENLPGRRGCDSVLTTTTLQADGSLGACCGIGMRLIPELQLGHVADTSLQQANRLAADDVLKRWIRVEGPERILAWAADHDPTIEWEDMYAHKCQACLRLYKDPKVRDVIFRHWQEKLPDVIFGEWLMFRYKGAALSADDREDELRVEGEQSPSTTGQVASLTD
jgi:Radical SAM superfamily